MLHQVLWIISISSQMSTVFSDYLQYITALLDKLQSLQQHYLLMSRIRLFRRICQVWYPAGGFWIVFFICSVLGRSFQHCCSKKYCHCRNCVTTFCRHQRSMYGAILLQFGASLWWRSAAWVMIQLLCILKSSMLINIVVFNWD